MKRVLVTVEPDLHERWKQEAARKGESMSGLVRRLLVRTLTEAGEDGAEEDFDPRDPRRNPIGAAKAGRTLAVSMAPLQDERFTTNELVHSVVVSEQPPAPAKKKKVETPARPHMMLHRPALECSSRAFVDGVCPDCGRPEQ
jgi:hypothetical protein